MTERFEIVVTPPDGDDGSLTVLDAMQQVLDAFQLLMSSSESDESITWRLVEAKTNSPPFSVVGEASSTRTGVQVDLIAKHQKKSFINNYNKLLSGTIPDSWKSSHSIESAKNFVRRNCNGIYKTEVKVDDDNSIILTQDNARSALDSMLAPRLLEASIHEQQVESYSQIGSVEGVMLDVTSYYNSPAIKIQERITGEAIWCLIEEEHRRQIVEEANFDDVWSGRRVRVQGKLEYESGKIIKVYAFEIIHIDPRKITIEDIKDRDFTSGLSVSDYIDKLREGQID